MYSTCECYGCVAQDEQRTELKEGMEIAVRRRRKRSLGNICFLGEMFKLQMLSEAVMHECITRLMKSTWNEESLERFAKLITITGKDLDNEAATFQMSTRSWMETRPHKRKLPVSWWCYYYTVKLLILIINLCIPSC